MDLLAFWGLQHKEEMMEEEEEDELMDMAVAASHA